MEKNEGEKAIMLVKAYNFENSFFTTPSKMLALANDNGRQLFLNFTVTSVNNKEGREDKLYFYTWYLEKQTINVEKRGGDDDDNTGK